MLSEREVVDFLVARKLVSARSITEGDLAVYDVSRRNVNFKLLSKRAPSYLVKQGLGTQGRSAIANEAAMYRALSEADPVAHHLPRFHVHDPDRGLLVLGLVEGAESLHSFPPRGRFSKTVGRALGRALGQLHAGGRGEDGTASAQDAAQPFTLSVHRITPPWLRELSGGNIDLVKRLQAARGVPEALDEVRAGWRAECLTHNDYKADNCLVVRAPGGGIGGVKLIDWEVGGVGDPAWDAGSVLGDYLSQWLGSIPITGLDPPERFAQLAVHPLERMRPALREFWDSYARAARLDAASADRRLLRAVRLSVARLLQTAFEQTQDTSHVPGVSICLLQVAVNVLARPHEAAVRLLGIPLRGAGAA